jgi:hypothetical protein
MEDKQTVNYSANRKQAVDTSFSLAELIQPLRNLRVKYLTLQTMDHYNKMEEQKKEELKVEKKGTWKSPQDERKQVQS